MAPPEPRVQSVAVAVHGALDFGELARLGLRPEEIVDFSANINPHGPALSVARAARDADISSYPDRDCREFRAAISRHTGVGADGVIPGNGSAELLDALARCYLAPKDDVLVVGPTFGEYERVSLLRGVKVLRFERDFSRRGAALDAEALALRVWAKRPRIVWLCNPNNPTGDYATRSQIERVLRAVREVGGMLVVDEAYRDLMPEVRADDLTNLLDTGCLVLIRSMTKAQALAGLRVGYALAPAEVIRTLAAVLPPWNVSAPAQAAGAAAFSASALAHLQRSREEIRRDKAYLAGALAELGFEVLPGETNYLLADAGRAGDGSSARSLLLAEGLQVRDCASFGLPAHIRVAVRRREECELLVGALSRVLSKRRAGGGA